MSGRRKNDPTKTQKQEIAQLKDECVKFYEKTGVKQAAADFVGRSLVRIIEWEHEDPEFRNRMLRAKATFLDNNREKVSPANVLANLYQDYRPPVQEVDVSGNLAVEHEVRSESALGQLLAASGFAPIAAGDHPEPRQAPTPSVD